jgi:hypothetical protein
MEKKFSKVLDELFDDPFESPLMLWISGAGAVIGLVLGMWNGFLHAGIGGAIAYGLGGLIAGTIVGFIVAMMVGFSIAAIPWLVLAAIVGAIVWGIHALWGIGRP